jgi:hypothetical protein
MSDIMIAELERALQNLAAQPRQFGAVFAMRMLTASQSLSDWGAKIHYIAWRSSFVSDVARQESGARQQANHRNSH